MKVSKWIRNRENYYVEMDDKDEIHIVNSAGNIVLSLTMKGNAIRLWGRPMLENPEEFKDRIDTYCLGG
jgi:hypothetical protein